MLAQRQGRVRPSIDPGQAPDRIPVRLEISTAYEGSRTICDALDKCSVAGHVSLGASVVPTALVNRVKPDDRHQSGLDTCARGRIVAGQSLRISKPWSMGQSAVRPPCPAAPGM